MTPKPFTIDDLSACISEKALADLAMTWVNYPAFLADVQAQNRTHVAHWIGALFLAGKIAQNESDAVTAVLAATEDEPKAEAPVPVVSRRSPVGTPGGYHILPPSMPAPRAANVGMMEKWRVLFDDKIAPDAPPEGFASEQDAQAWVDQWFIDWYAKNPMIEVAA